MPVAKKKKQSKGRGRPRGRPVELTDAVLKRIAKHVADGNYLETAAHLEGASIHYVRELIREGAREERQAREQAREIAPKLERAVMFAQAIRQARAKAEKDDLDVISKAGKEQWQARAWRLERREPNRWARRERHDHTHSGRKGAPPVTVAALNLDPEFLKTLSDEELNVLERAVRKLGSAGDDSGGEGAAGS